MVIFNDAVADPAARKGEGAEKHEIYATVKGGQLFMTYFYRARGAMAPSSPPPTNIRYWIACHCQFETILEILPEVDGTTSRKCDG